MSKRKTTFISINEKYLAIKRIENGENKQTIMNEYNIGRSTLYGWIKIKDDLYRQINIHDNKRKNIRKAVNVDIDKEIYTWFKHNRGNNIPLSGNFIIYIYIYIATNNVNLNYI